MEDAYKHLLSKQQITNFLFLLREAKREFEAKEITWSVIGKYMERLWYQQAMHKKYSELLLEYQILALQLDRLEQQMNEYKASLYMHRCATEYLHKSMKPYEKINLHQHQLIQQTMF